MLDMGPFRGLSKAAQAPCHGGMSRRPLECAAAPVRVGCGVQMRRIDSTSFAAWDYRGFIAFCIAFVALAAAAHFNFHLAGDGYLWYGTQRVLAGEIPLRDFMSYDPARYYLAAASTLLLGDRGPAAINLGMAFLGALAVWAAIRLIVRGGSSPWWYWLPASIAIIVWMEPRIKLFDIVASVTLVASLAWLVEKATWRRCMVNGVVVGLVAIVGRNHGLYGAIAGAITLGYLAFAEKRIRLLPSAAGWSLGILIGYSPMLLAMLLVPGFTAALWASIHVYVEIGATNAPVPVPWPWRVLAHGLHGIPAWRSLLHGLLLLSMPLFGVAVLGVCAWRARVSGMTAKPGLLAAAALSIPYVHHALGRADVAHLAQAMQPMLIGVLLLAAAFDAPRRAAAGVGILAISLFIALPLQDAYQRWHEGNWVEAAIGSDTMQIPPKEAARVAALDQLISTYAPQDREFVAVPELAGAYALADRRAAVWNTYAVLPADEAIQQQEIARMQAEHPAFVLIEAMGDSPYAYPRTHPRVYDFIARNFTRLDASRLPPGLDDEVFVPLNGPH